VAFSDDWLKADRPISTETVQKILSRSNQHLNKISPCEFNMKHKDTF